MTPEEKIISVVRRMVGASKKIRAAELDAFLRRGHEGPPLLSDKVSNCGLFALSVWFESGVDHPLLLEPYKCGMAIAWVTQIAFQLRAARTLARNGLPVPGSLCHYYSHRPSTDDHVEFCLENQAGKSVSLHAGGGRKSGAITAARHDVRWNSGRPLQHWYEVFPVTSPSSLIS